LRTMKKGQEMRRIERLETWGAELRRMERGQGMRRMVREEDVKRPGGVENGDSKKRMVIGLKVKRIEKEEEEARR
jgi:hypothetical protein